MTKEFDDRNRGALFREAKSKETDRDFGGWLDVDGKKFWLSGWISVSQKTGTKKQDAVRAEA
jgi:hypothetical protein